MGRTGHSALIIGISAAAVLSAGTVVALTRGEPPVARAETTLGPVSDAIVTSTSGHSRVASAGASLAPGEVVTTGRHGNAALLTRGRVTLLASNAVLEVGDGAHQQLRTGTAVIDAQEGPGVTLDIAGDSIVVPAGSAIEAQRGTAVRIGALAGPVGVTNGSGRHLSLAALWQVIVTGDSLPGAPTPLQLSNSRSVQAAEARAVPELVADNLAMKALARGIDSTGNSTAHVVEASWTGTFVPRGVGVTRSDQVLPAVIADATAHAGGTPQQRYDRVVSWRAEGGSWGVVVHLLSARAAQVADALHSLQESERQGALGNTSATGLGPPPITPATPGIGHHPAGPSTPTPGTTHTPPPATTPPTTGGGGKTPTPKPTQSPTVVGGVVGTVGKVLNGLLGILPGNQPTKHATKQQSVTLPSTTTVTSAPVRSNLIGDLLGGVGGLVGGLASL